MKRISFEFFPPKTDEGRTKLLTTQQKLLAKKPAFFSCTFGAGGSTRDNTREMVDKLREQHADTAPHLSCIGQSREEILELVRGYRDSGVRRIVALRGDLPSGMGYAQSEVKYADDLVRLIREETGNHFTLEVAAYPEMHPQARSFEDDIAHFKRKIDAGANSGLTQYFYNADAYGYYMDALRRTGCDAPVYPGIMPILNVANLIRFSGVCGADIPRWLRSKLDDIKDDEQAVKAFGEEVVTRLCERLLAMGAPGLHFYTMNQSQASLRILDNLGL
ncbi:5,10-methylenetetrahydrofolate reductase [Alcanivorax balearicus MACL04]|uniref:Methylenetetrahydrofolate reductase n=1 Tax=Alloalcanivorax balearicus MACL04 TaxID=1177182 RepID=A0ABT2QXE6_9GAMM|nr:methylenetetrahydrofolate reductase [NAD(P)H] [Alloalcanivorax balearicus]MCU5782194.1 5,10-methylenetetrahydrofolate reductase [Alloalcanivorax balearicus MACL04]